MNKKYVRKNYIWLGSNFKKLYLHKYNNQVIKIFSEAIIKEINLFVTYDIYNRYNMCYSKPDNNITLKNSKLFKADNKLKFFFDYFQKKKLNCVEFEIELVDGTLLKTFYGNDFTIRVPSLNINTQSYLSLLIIFPQMSKSILRLS